jgi:signal transduction histidine kinase
LWIILFLALHYASPIANTAEVQLLVVAAIFELLEPRIPFFRDSAAGRIASAGIRLIEAYLLIGVTGGITSSYYLILLLPVVTAATLFSALPVFLWTTLAGASYLSFLLFLDFTRYIIPPDQQQEITFRILFLYLAAFLTYQLARSNRESAERYQALAGELQQANQNLLAAQAEAQRSERLAALGQLTAGLAHELRNPLGIIKNSAEMLAKRAASTAPADMLTQELTGYISHEVERTNLLVKRFLDFAKPFRLQLELVEISPLIDQAADHVATKAQERSITIYRQDSPGLEPVPADRQWLTQLLINLLTNAIEASSEGGVVSISAREAAQGIEIAVSDQGPGIPEENRQAIFNPFFTTKPEGTGLGLAIVAKIVDEHRGRIFVESGPGSGATFRIWLPERTEPA